jgi:superoxide dismutase, Fe-Mn family
MTFELPPLPYARDALAPHISEETLDFHYGKHHQAYVNNLNKLTEGTPLAHEPLEHIILNEEGGVFNNAAQVWNHTFYWNCLSPNGGGAPSGELAEAINKHFESFDQFKELFSQAAATQFGSGWAWLWQTPDGKMEIGSTANADNPMRAGNKPLLTCDVWEHAYYIDTRNDRPQYIKHFWELVNWDFVTEQL